MFSAKDLVFAKGPAGGYTIAKSLRFRSSASAYLSRTFSASPTTRTLQTFSVWVKRGALGTQHKLFSGYDGSSVGAFIFDFTAADQLEFWFGGSAANNIISTSVYRDPSAWYHVVAAVDTTQATASNRVKLWVNGVQITSFGTANYPAQNALMQFTLNNANNKIGTNWDAVGGYTDGYLSEVNFIDGQALTPSSFGETNTATGVWMPKAYTGTYGTNGFYLQFSDVGATSGSNTGYGKDFAGTNYWTTNNLSSTTGVTYDSMVDTPTNYDNGGNGAGNYAVLNPLDKGSIITLSAANLTCDYSGTATDACTFSTIAFDAGSTNFYAEFTLTAISLSASDVAAVGITDVNTVNSASISTSGTAVLYLDSGSKVVNGTTTAFGASWTTNDVIGVYVNQGTITFYKNGTSQGNAATGVSGTYKFVIRGRSGVSRTFTVAANFGQRAFSNTPSGAKALCTQNLPTPTIGATNSTIAANYMNAVTYSGTSASNTVVASATNSGNNPLAITFQPDFVWIKSRSAATDHKLTDSVRGVTKALISNTTGAETTDTNGLTAFTSTGFTVGSDSIYNNGTGPATYVAWEWKAGGAGGSSNTSGTITSTVSANVTAGFSVVTYTGTGASAATVGHGLGVAPSLIIIKQRNGSTYGWVTYHRSVGAGSYLVLNGTGAAAADTAMFSNTSPSSTVFTLSNGADIAITNPNTGTMVAYCFAEVAGYSKFGSYTGLGGAEGPFVYCGFRPRFLLIKSSSLAGANWIMIDTARDTYNVSGAKLAANSADAENSGATGIAGGVDILSNGFKPRINWSELNSSGATFIFAAFAESPFNYARAR